jgi:hypothetical protein
MARLVALSAGFLSLALSLGTYGAGDPQGWREGPWVRAASPAIVGGDGSRVDLTLHRGSADLRKADERRIAERERVAEH